MLKKELKRLLKGSFVYGLGGVLQRFLSFLLLPLFTRVLQPEEYGAIALVGLVSVGVTGLFNLGTMNSLGILYFKEKDERKRPSRIWTNFLLLSVYGSILYAIFFAVAPFLSALMFQTNEYAVLFRIALIGVLISTVSGPLLAYLRMEERAKTYVLLTLISSLTSLGTSVYLVVFLRLGAMGVLIAGAIASFSVFIILFFLVLRLIPFSFDLKVVKPLVRIGFPGIWGLFAFMIIDYADRQMIQRFIGLDALGVYSVGYNFGMVMIIFENAFALAWPPFFVSFQSRTKEACLVFGRVLKYYVIVSGFLILAFFGFARPVISLMVAEVYQSAFVVVGMVAAAYMLKGVYLIFLPGIYFAEKLFLQTSIEWIAAFTNIALNFFLIPRYGIAGAAIATLGCYSVLPVLTVLISRRFLDVKYEWSKLLRSITVIGVFSVLLFIPSNWFPEPFFMIGLSFLALASFVVLSYFWFFSGNERNWVNAKVMVILKKRQYFQF